MAAAPKFGYAQDMPPPGGYGPVQYKREYLRTIFSTKVTIAVWAVCTVGGWIAYSYSWRRRRDEKLELRSARFAMLPMLAAERDRAFLKQCRKNRDMERELMKDYPEWDVGTYFREPIYRTMPDQFHEPVYQEYMLHADLNDVNFRILRRHFT